MTRRYKQVPREIPLTFWERIFPWRIRFYRLRPMLAFDLVEVFPENSDGTPNPEWEIKHINIGGELVFETAPIPEDRG